MADSIDRLYELPLDEFVAERDALAKRLRSEKQRSEADEVKASRKPSVAAWAMNQALRARPKDLAALLKAGDALAAASSGDEIRAAQSDQRDAVSALVEAARSSSDSLSDSTVDRIRETLVAAATSEEAREEVSVARVSREHSAAGFGPFVLSEEPPPEPPRRERKGASKKDSSSSATPTAEEKRAAAAERKAAEQARKAEEKAAREAAREAERERKAALREARAELREAERELTSAEKRVAAAQKAVAALE